MPENILHCFDICHHKPSNGIDGLNKNIAVKVRLCVISIKMVSKNSRAVSDTREFSQV